MIELTRIGLNNGEHFTVQHMIGTLFLLSVTLGCRTPGSGSSLVDLEGDCSSATFERVTTDPVVISPPLLEQTDKKVALIYYVVDTPEPFMVYSVDHELRALRDACSHEPVNWISFVNSHFMHRESPAIAVCRSGQFELEPVDPEVAFLFDIKRRSLVGDENAYEDYLDNRYPEGRPDPDTRQGGNELFTARRDFDRLVYFRPAFPPSMAEDFMRYPLAHPQFFYDLLSYAREKIFPANQYSYVVHLKSHGSMNLFLTGLTANQEREKAECQLETVNEVRREQGLGQVGLGQVGLGQVGLGQVGLGQVGLGQVGLGQVGLGQVGLGQVGLGQVGLGHSGLGQHGLGAHGLGTAGLGTSGLGTSNHFGVANVPMVQVLNRYLGREAGRDEAGTPRNENNTEILFLLFESCDSNNRKKQDTW